MGSRPVRAHTRIIDADVADAQAALDEYENLMLLMQAQVATLYFSIRQYSSEIELLERTVKVRKDQTQYISRRLKYGEANDVDMQRALQEEYEASAQLASVERQMAVARNDIAILAGTVPSRLDFKILPLPEAMPRLPRGHSGRSCSNAGPTSRRPSARCTRQTRA